MHEPPLWIVQRGRTAVRIFGGGPPLAEPWSSPELEALVAASDVFWNEVPKMGTETQALAITYGLDPAAPLATWLTPEDLARVEAAAEAVAANPQILAAVRPWLAAQLLNMAAQSLAGLHGEYSAEEHLTATAERAGVPVQSEFATPEAVFKSFSSWPREVEIDRLRYTLAELESGAGSLRHQADAWLKADRKYGEELDAVFRRDFPGVYDHLVVRRNRAWIERIADMLVTETSAFIVVGGGHLVGPAAVPILLERADMKPRCSAE